MTFPRPSFDGQTPPGNQYNMSSSGPDTTVGSPFDESSSPSSFTRNSTTSAAATSISSIMSNNAWSPLDSPIDEEVLFSNTWRNEYYMVDGKTSSYNPGRGDQPVKAMWRRVEDDGTIRSGSGLDWPPSNRVHNSSELMTPVSPSCPIQPDVRARREMEESEQADDYFHRYHAQVRHLGG